MRRRKKDYWLEYNGRGHSISQHETNQAVVGNVWHTNLPMWLFHIKSHNSSSILCSKTLCSTQVPNPQLWTGTHPKNATTGVRRQELLYIFSLPYMGTNPISGASVNCAINFYIVQSREEAKIWSLPFSTSRGEWRKASSRGLFWLELLRWQHLLMEESHSVKGCKIKGQNWARFQTTR